MASVKFSFIIHLWSPLNLEFFFLLVSRWQAKLHTNSLIPTKISCFVCITKKMCSQSCALAMKCSMQVSICWISQLVQHVSNNPTENFWTKIEFVHANKMQIFFISILCFQCLGFHCSKFLLYCHSQWPLQKQVAHCCKHMWQRKILPSLMKLNAKKSVY